MAEERSSTQHVSGDYNANAQSGNATVNVTNIYQGVQRSDSATYLGIIGLPPPTDSRTIEQRTLIVKAINGRLLQQQLNALVLTGIGGVGKSTLAALVYQDAQAQHGMGTSPFAAPPLWLSLDRSVTFADLAATLFQAVGKPVPELGSLSPPNQAAALFMLLDTLEASRLIVLDQFENLLDWTSGYALPTKVGVGEWLDALNGQRWTGGCRMLLTSRPRPRGTREYPPTYLREFPVEGLTLSEGLDLLQKRGVQAPEADLRRAVTYCNGHALSLTLLIALVQDYGMSLTSLLTDSILWEGDIASNLLDAIFGQLNETQRNLLRACSVYRTPIPLEAISPFMGVTSPAEVLRALRALLTQHLIQPMGEGHYQLHAIVASYARQHVVEGERQINQQAVQEMHAKAAQYYLQQAEASCPAREHRRQVSEVQPLMEAVWQYAQAGKWQEAYSVVEQEELFANLSLWGGNVLLLELCQLLLHQTNWQPKRDQEAMIYLNLGGVYNSLGKKPEALDYFQQALAIYREVGDRGGEGTTLNNLGRVYNSLGQKPEALDYFQQALAIRREVGDRGGEGITLWNIGACLFQQQHDVSLAAFLLAQHIFEEVQSPYQHDVLSWIASLGDVVGEQQFAVLVAQVEPHAQQVLELFLHRKQG